jgi:hypothetical protein
MYIGPWKIAKILDCLLHQVGQEFVREKSWVVSAFSGVSLCIMLCKSAIMIVELRAS